MKKLIMARNARLTLLYVVVPIVFFTSLYHHYIRYAIPISSDIVRLRPILSLTTTTANITITTNHANYENRSLLKVSPRSTPRFLPHAAGHVIPTSPYSTTSVLMPDWEVLVIVSPEDTPSLLASLPGHAGRFVCAHFTKEVTPATPSPKLSFPDRAAFRCLLPPRARRKLPFLQPALMRTAPVNSSEGFLPASPMLYWTNLAYDSLTADDGDVVLFVKGVIKKQNIIRKTSEFRCVFGDDAVKTAVKTSTLEVFRCQRPKLTARLPLSGAIKVSLEILTEKRVVPTVAYYSPKKRKLASPSGKSLLCACTMVYNAAKFLKEWVYYHSKIGVQKFVLYDNGSDDDLASVVKELDEEGYDVVTIIWLWSKTQEAGFSHAALYARHSCSWMMYVDVDEFVYSPDWLNSSQPSKSMLQSLLQNRHHNYQSLSSSSENLTMNSQLPVGQINIWCQEYGPSNQTSHPATGVTQGYVCRLKAENRHKSIVSLDAVDESLYNVIHHFKLREGYRSRVLGTKRMIVNHYKYQAWPEFKVKFRRRVSAYVIDWRQPLNLKSQDRPRGLGPMPVEPKDWPGSYCQVYDTRLRDLTRMWFAIGQSPAGYRMPWQR